MKEWFKELFCKHIFRDECSIHLTQKKIAVPGTFIYNTYDYYAVTQKCVECGKDRIETRRVLVI